MIIESNNYFAKATFPPANPWKSQWGTKIQAIKQAHNFVQQWARNGLTNAKAGVFYRDGTMVLEVSPECEPDANPDQSYHDDRGDN